MRKQARPHTPQVLLDHGERWTQQWLDLRQRRKDSGHSPPSFNWYEADGKAANESLIECLRPMNQEHCSFCDAFPVGGVSRETIEHFRPKSRDEFAHLAYEWGNLFYCCDACQSHKRERWDDDLIAPDGEHYSFNRFFVCDHITGEIRPNPAATTSDQHKADVTIEFYGLNAR